MTDKPPDRQAQLIALIERDYDATRSLIDSVISTSVQLRVIAMTLTVALLGFAVERSSFPVALCAIASTLLFAYLDAYHGWIYAQALARARKHERILRRRYRQLERGADEPDSTHDLDLALAKHQFGQYLALERFRLRSLGRARPRSIYLGLYGGLLALAVAAAIYGVAT
jgi:hypothetical protein